VILINLLPHREMARQRARQMFNISLGIAAAIGFGLAVMAFLGYQAAIAVQNSRNDLLTREIKKVDEEIKEVASLEQEIAALKARQEAVENLQADRNMPVHLMNEALHQLPDGIYLSSIKQADQNVLIGGVAQSNERVADLLRNLSRQSEWITKPELIEIAAANVPLRPKEERRVNNFTVRVQLQRASDVAAAQAAASAAQQRGDASKGA
jgi:type IV pilus assembly protein PilN